MDKYNNIDMYLDNSTPNPILDNFDNFYSKHSKNINSDQENPKNFLNYLAGDYNTKYLNIKPTRYLDKNHLKAFLDLKSKKFESYKEPEKKIDVNEPVINLKNNKNRKDYIKHLKKKETDYNLLESLQESQSDYTGFNF
jgi:hypothetical protein